jgi:type II secretory pathway pseudopilin PulG
VNEDGFTFAEGLLALVVLGIVLAGVVPLFFHYMDVTTRNEARSGAIAAAQQQIEAARSGDPTSMPSSGASSPSYITVNDREYEVVTQYCLVNEFCSSSSRHLTIEVSYAGRTVYTTESVFTQLR